MDSLQVMSATDLLSPAELARLQELQVELARTFETVQVFRTHTEMLVSVLNDVKHPTPDSKYWQAVREQDVMFTELVMLSYEYRKTLLETEQTRRKLAAEEDDLARALLAVEIERQDYIAANMRRTAHHRMREIALWSKIKAELEPQLVYGIEDVDAHQLEAMRKRFSAEASLVSQHTPVADARNILGLAVTAQRIGNTK
jgi:hypothetical protein